MTISLIRNQTVVSLPSPNNFAILNNKWKPFPQNSETDAIAGKCEQMYTCDTHTKHIITAFLRILCC